ncbi:hypothetical protein C8Q74DRAFT_1364605 [Fomes fomentarius]|nr:hypothetical protein C8Q74DRAFT_1364605 [Fomes fomentarius]
MDYFKLAPAGQTASSSTGQLSPVSLVGRSPHHAVIILEGGEQESATPLGTPLDQPSGTISISTTFHPFLSLDGSAPDVVLTSTDGVHFYAHRQRLLAVSTNNMGTLIPPDSSVVIPALPTPQTSESVPSSLYTVRMPLRSEVVNVILHTIYGLSCAQYLPTLETVEAALEALALLYGISVKTHTTPGAPMYELILAFAPFLPLDAYAVAAHHELEELCVAISPRLLAYDLARLPDVAAQKMGPLYLKRLFLLHQNRLSALRDILFKAPSSHPPAPRCSEETRQQRMRGWAFAVAELVWDVLPSVSTSALRSLLEPIGMTITCPLCIAGLQQRVEEVMHEWAAVKATI